MKFHFSKCSISSLLLLIPTTILANLFDEKTTRLDSIVSTYKKQVFVYDELNRRVEDTLFSIDNGSVNPVALIQHSNSGNTEYQEFLEWYNGRWIKKYYNTTLFYPEENRTEITSESNHQELFYNEKNLLTKQVITTGTLPRIAFYQYDQHNNRTSMATDYAFTGEYSYYTTTYEYDTFNNIVTEIDSSGSEGNLNFYQLVENKYDSSQNILNTTWYCDLEKSSWKGKSDYTYNENGQITSVNHFENGVINGIKSAIPMYRCDYKYSQKDSLVTVTVYSSYRTYLGIFFSKQENTVDMTMLKSSVLLLKGFNSTIEFSYPQLYSGNMREYLGGNYTEFNILYQNSSTFDEISGKYSKDYEVQYYYSPLASHAETNLISQDEMDKNLQVRQIHNQLHFSKSLAIDSKLKIISLNGRVISIQNVTGDCAQLPSLAQGVYFAQLITNNRIQNLKIVVQ